MFFERIKSPGIAHNSYFIASGNSAAVIDPRRDYGIYLDIAREHGCKIKYIFETHRNEDYVVGSLGLADTSGAGVYHGPRQDWKYGTVIDDRAEFKVGKTKLRAIYTPGHTDESVSYTLTDLSTGNTPVMVFTGDTLFVGGTGRVDLFGERISSRLAGFMYDSIFNRILTLGDGVIIYPAHGGGSVCGARIADRDESTIGTEKIQNPDLQFENKPEFVQKKIEEKLETPPYFTQMEKYNLEGVPPLKSLPEIEPLSPREFSSKLEKGALVVDTSEPAAFGGAYIKGSYSIWQEGLPSFAGWVLPYDKDILLVLGDRCHLENAIQCLVRLGYDRIAGYLKGGVEAWYNAGMQVESLPLFTVQRLKQMLDHGEDLIVLDVRGQSEWESGHVKEATHIYVGHLKNRLGEVPRDKPVAVMCSIGHRSGLAASILLRAGLPQVYNVLGGSTAWVAAGYPMTID